MPAAHLPTSSQIGRWPEFSAADPLPLLVSSCITGEQCGSDATSYGAPFPHTEQLLMMPNIRSVKFCPEDFAFGTPRRIPDIHGGDGFAVLDGTARVLSASGEDWTEPMLAAAHAMLERAASAQVRLALLMDISAACGSQVIYLGARTQGVYQAGMGVAAALLVRNGIPILSPRDFRTLGLVLHKLDPRLPIDPAARDHHESDWYVDSFGR